MTEQESSKPNKCYKRCSMLVILLLHGIPQHPPKQKGIIVTTISIKDNPCDTIVMQRICSIAHRDLIHSIPQIPSNHGPIDYSKKRAPRAYGTYAVTCRL